MSTVLSLEQLKVIKAPVDVPLIVVTATAGAGKTQTLIGRAAALVGEHRVLPHEILILSFTRVAQSEVAARLKARRLQQVRVATLHSYALTALERAGHAVTLVSDTQLEGLAQNVARACLPSRYAFDSEGSAEYVLRRVSYLNQRAETVISDEDRLILQTFQDEFDELRTREDDSLATYDQVLTRFRHWLRAAESHPQVAMGPTKHLIVDEAQDLSPLQYEIVRLLAQGRQLMLVGDPAQAIFGFQGSSPDLLHSALQEADRCYTLSTNHRSPASHVELSAGLFPTPVTVNAAKQHTPVHAEFVPESQLATRLVMATEHMLEELTQTGIEAKVAILVRSRREAKEVTKLLLRAGLSAQAVGRRRQELDPYTRLWLIPCLDYVTSERMSARHPLLRLPCGAQISGDERELFNAAWLAGVSPAEVAPFIPRKSEGKTLIAVWQSLESARISSSGELADALRSIAYELSIDGSRLEAEHLCRQHPDLAELRLALAEQPSATEQPPGTVLVSTIHAAKGREWPAVILTELPMNRFSSRDPEEFRLRYVALTRSTHLLAAVLPEICHPAYRAAFQSGELAAVNRIADLLSRDASTWTPADHAFVGERQRKFPHIGSLVSRAFKSDRQQESGVPPVVRVPIRWHA
ncbi:UvrD-helicase domain-containing protein [Deinococcus antarcticus]|uniref:UvrD-helicase domain-containing protein n=1 Tax=Deinococcus antarcticus TaxID=1298767 RepID=A0ABV8ABF1_9DEIO